MYALPLAPPDKAAVLERLRRKSDIQQVFREGRHFHSQSVVLHARRRPVQEGAAPGCRLAVVAGRQFRSAVERNRVRRLLRETSRLLLREMTSGMTSSWDLVLVARGDVLGGAHETRLEDLTELFRSAGVLRERVGSPT